MRERCSSWLSSALLLIAAFSSGAALAGTLPEAPLDDQCRAIPGYAEFRRTLEQVIERRDGPAFEALFARGGGMRVEGFGGQAARPGWGWDRPQAAGVWRELDRIMPLGCASDGRQLYLPAMAILIDHPDVEPGYVATLSRRRVGSRPDAHAQGGSRMVKRGQLLEVVAYDHPKGWIEVSLEGRSAYIPATAVRSPHSYYLALKNEDGSWRIWEFNSGV